MLSSTRGRWCNSTGLLTLRRGHNSSPSEAFRWLNLLETEVTDAHRAQSDRSYKRFPIPVDHVACPVAR
jgi:hypothetical protein